MKQKAYSKINLSLNVKYKRTDGFHELESVMLPLELADELEIDIAEEDSYQCDQDLPFTRQHTVYKAISLLKEKYHITDHHKIILKKTIPWQAGLGGGSADGAAAIRIFERLYDLRLTKEEIADLCHRIGSDVIFTYYHTPAYVKGTGEDLSFFSLKDDLYILLAKPQKGISTKEAYGNLDLGRCDHPDCLKIKDLLEKGEDISAYLGNSLEEPSLRLCKEIRDLKDQISLKGFTSLMSGSGSCVFVLGAKEELLSLKEELSADFLTVTRVLR